MPDRAPMTPTPVPRSDARRTPPRRVLVVGATGRTGRHLVHHLLASGVDVRALVRSPHSAALPREVHVVPGTLQDLAAVREAGRGCDAAFLIWPGADPQEVAPTVTALTLHVPHVVYLSAADLGATERPTVMPGMWATVEAALEASPATWTFLRAGGFAANAQQWAEQIRTGDTVRMVHPDAGRSPVHELDLVRAAVRALLDPGLDTRTPTLTGPETLTLREQVETIGRVLDRPLRVVEQDPDEAREEFAGIAGADFADRSLRYWASLVDNPEPVSPDLSALLGGPATTFEEWVQDHRREFEADRPTEVAAR